MTEESKIEKLKEEYEKIQKKYSLPDFTELNRDFHIEKISETETESLTREIRKHIADKIYNYMRLTETLLNPVNAPMFVFSIIKSIDENEKKKISDIYKRLSEIEIELIKLDLDYDEKKDAEFIKKAYKSWQRIKKDLFEVIDKSEKKEDSKKENNNKGYFG